MSTPAQIHANRQNAQSSTGPRTPEGKAAASRNAVKHGLSAAFAVLPNENRQEFQDLLIGYCEEFSPKSKHEFFLVEQMVQARWKLARTRRLESAVIGQMLVEAGADADPDQLVAQMMLKGKTNPLAALHRHAAAAERSYYMAHAIPCYSPSRATKQTQSAAYNRFQRPLPMPATPPTALVSPASPRTILSSPSR